MQRSSVHAEAGTCDRANQISTRGGLLGELELLCVFGGRRGNANATVVKMCWECSILRTNSSNILNIETDFYVQALLRRSRMDDDLGLGK